MNGKEVLLKNILISFPDKPLGAGCKIERT